MAIVTGLRAEHVTDGVVGVAAPRLSWQVETDHPGWVQHGYQVRVRRGGAWHESERQDSAEQVLVPWPGEPLSSREEAEASVRVWGGDGSSDWCEPLTVEAGLLGRGDWVARLAQPPRTGDDACAYLRREFDAPAVDAAHRNSPGVLIESPHLVVVSG